MNLTQPHGPRQAPPSSNGPPTFKSSTTASPSLPQARAPGAPPALSHWVARRDPAQEQLGGWRRPWEKRSREAPNAS